MKIFAEPFDQASIASNDFVQFNLGASDSAHLDYKLFVTTHLGFGANMAQEKYHEMLINQYDREDQAIAGKSKSFKDAFHESVVQKLFLMTIVSNLKFQTLVYHLAPEMPEIISSLLEAGTTHNVTTPSHPYFTR